MVQDEKDIASPPPISFKPSETMAVLFVAVLVADFLVEFLRPVSDSLVVRSVSSGVKTLLREFLIPLIPYICWLITSYLAWQKIRAYCLAVWKFGQTDIRDFRPPFWLELVLCLLTLLVVGPLGAFVHCLPFYFSQYAAILLGCEYPWAFRVGITAEVIYIVVLVVYGIHDQIEKQKRLCVLLR